SRSPRDTSTPRIFALPVKQKPWRTNWFTAARPHRRPTPRVERPCRPAGQRRRPRTPSGRRQDPSRTPRSSSPKARAPGPCPRPRRAGRDCRRCRCRRRSDAVSASHELHAFHGALLDFAAWRADAWVEQFSKAPAHIVGVVLVGAIAEQAVEVFLVGRRIGTLVVRS